jgi:DNA adenine methylase
MLKPFFPRVGGKYKLRDQIYTHFPTHSVKTYIEPFLGGGAIFLGNPCNADFYILNDLDRDIYNLWLDITAVSHNDLNYFDFVKDKDTFDDFLETEFDNPVDRFYRNLYLSVYSFSGNRKTFAVRDRTFKNTRLKKHLTDYKRLLLSNTALLNQDYKVIVERYDGEDSFFYLDPPYSAQTKQWGYIDNIDPRDMFAVFSSIKGKVALSYDDTPEIRDLFKSYRIEEINTTYTFNNKNKLTRELLICNW